MNWDIVMKYNLDQGVYEYCLIKWIQSIKSGIKILNTSKKNLPDNNET